MDGVQSDHADGEQPLQEPRERPQRTHRAELLASLRPDEGYAQRSPKGEGANEGAAAETTGIAACKAAS